MAKRNKKKLKGQAHKTASLNALSPEKLLKQGNLLLQQEKFQDAIACFKHLVKLEQREDFLQGLQQAYRGRIMALAAKSMFKEAIALLDTLAQRCPDVRVDPLRLGLLLQAGSYLEAARLYGLCHDQLAPEQQARVAALFGVLLLASNDIKPEDFAADSPIVQVYPKALAAIELFGTGQAEKLEEALRQIPIRSPYRDLRTLLTGLHHLPKDKAQKDQILRKITAESPYYHSAAGFLTTDNSAKALLADLVATPKAQRLQLPQLHGMPVSHLRVLEELAQTGGEPMPLLRIIRRNARCFDQVEIRALYGNILPFCRGDAFDVAHGSPAMDVAEKYRVCALAAEYDNIPSYAVAFWSDYLETIDRKEPSRFGEIAMIIRRQAMLMKKDRYVYPPQEILDTMLRSLEYDPGHAPTWLDASEYSRRHLGLQQHYAIIGDAVQKLPNEVSILLAAMRAGSNRGAHKKAAGLAAKVLALDPINTAALDFLVLSRLEHGRKLASQKKWALAEKELLSADTRARSIRYKGRSRICLGMLLLLQNNDAGLVHIEAGRAENPYPLLGHVLVALEARLYGLIKARQKEFDRLLKQHVDTALAVDPKELHRLIYWILGFEGNHWSQLKEVCQVLKGYFVGAAAVDMSPAEGLSLCRALEKIDLAPGLVKCSTVLKKKYPDVLEFKVWYLIASAWQKNRPISPAVYDGLEDLFDKLSEKQQFDFIEHIGDIIERRELEPSFYVDQEDINPKDFFIDFGPFGAPKIMPNREKQKKPVQPVQPRGKQRSLFDDQ